MKRWKPLTRLHSTVAEHERCSSCNKLSFGGRSRSSRRPGTRGVCFWFEYQRKSERLAQTWRTGSYHWTRGANALSSRIQRQSKTIVTVVLLSVVDAILEGDVVRNHDGSYVSWASALPDERSQWYEVASRYHFSAVTESRRAEL